MKKQISIILILAMLIMAGCTGAPATSEVPSGPALSEAPGAAQPTATAPQTTAPMGKEEVENRSMTLSFGFGDRTGDYTGTLENGLPQGEGSFLYYVDNEDGTKAKREYRGSFEQGHLNGTGSMYYDDKLHFEGTWDDDLEVNGKWYLDTGAYYDGDIADGDWNGEGKYYDEKGNLYMEGTFQDGVIAKGTVYNEDGSAYYQGEFADGAAHGQGIGYFNGYTFEGRYENGTGVEGTLTYPEGVKYIGTLKDGSKRHGAGKMVDENGVTRYEGEYQNDVENGQGKLYDEKGKLLYEGEFIDGVPETEVPKVYSANTYIVGKDLPAGEYFLDAGGKHCYYEVTRDSSGDFESIIDNGNTESTVYITLEKGQYFSFSRGTIIPSEDREKNIQEQVDEGMYKVGVDIAAGEYKLTAQADSAYVAVYKNTKASSGIRAIRTNDNFSGSKYQTVKKGEYLLLNRCSAELVK